MRAALRNAIKQLFGLLSPGLVAKTLLRNNWGGGLSMKRQIPNIDVVRSAWRRVKKDIKDAIIRDLKPVKEVKGGGGVEGKSACAIISAVPWTLALRALIDATLVGAISAWLLFRYKPSRFYFADP